MTVGELRELLADLPDEAPVFIGFFESTPLYGVSRDYIGSDKMYISLLTEESSNAQREWSEELEMEMTEAEDMQSIMEDCPCGGNCSCGN